jgi:hypothetical protein
MIIYDFKRPNAKPKSRWCVSDLSSVTTDQTTDQPAKHSRVIAKHPAPSLSSFFCSSFTHLLVFGPIDDHRLPPSPSPSRSRAASRLRARARRRGAGGPPGVSSGHLPRNRD